MSQEGAYTREVSEMEIPHWILVDQVAAPVQHTSRRVPAILAESQAVWKLLRSLGLRRHYVPLNFPFPSSRRQRAEGESQDLGNDNDGVEHFARCQIALPRLVLIPCLLYRSAPAIQPEVFAAQAPSITYHKITSLLRKSSASLTSATSTLAFHDSNRAKPPFDTCTLSWSKDIRSYLGDP
jgi:hypothetical protein